MRPSPFAWRRPIGLPYNGPERARQDVAAPLIDDGPWGGVPIGGMGAGSIGRTHRGGFARWHLDVGTPPFRDRPGRPVLRVRGERVGPIRPCPLDDPPRDASDLELGHA